MARVKEITGGAGVDVVYDSVGKDTFPKSLDCIKPLGLWVTFGNASGPVPAFEMTLLSQKGSLYVTRPTLFTYIAQRQALVDNANDVMDMVRFGRVKIRVTKTYPMADAAQAHRDLESRATTGSVVLLADYAVSSICPPRMAAGRTGFSPLILSFSRGELASASSQLNMTASVSGCSGGEGTPW